MVVHGADFESKPQQDLSLESCPALSAVAKVTVSKEMARFRHLFVKCVAQAAGIKCLAKRVCVCVCLCVLAAGLKLAIVPQALDVPSGILTAQPTAAPNHDGHVR